MHTYMNVCDYYLQGYYSFIVHYSSSTPDPSAFQEGGERNPHLEGFVRNCCVDWELVPLFRD